MVPFFIALAQGYRAFSYFVCADVKQRKGIIMTFKEVLLAAGMTGAKADDVIEQMKSNKMFIASEDNLDIRYGKLKTDHDAKLKELEEANKTIESLKKSAGDVEASKAKIEEYEGKVKELQDTLSSEGLSNAVKNGLRDAKAKDIDYLTYKLGKDLKLNDKGEIEGWEDKINALKKDHPTQFESEAPGKKTVIPNTLKDGKGEHTLTKDEFLKMNYSERVALYQNEPETYKALMSEA